MNAREEYSARLAGFPHPDGHYNGEYRTENGRTWFYIAADNGMDYETEDAPEVVIVLGDGAAHEERIVKDFAGRVIYAVSNIPPYWQAYCQRMKQQ